MKKQWSVPQITEISVEKTEDLTIKKYGGGTDTILTDEMPGDKFQLCNTNCSCS